MARYNVKSIGLPKMKTHEGGEGYAYDAKSELVAMLATGIDNKFYEELGERETRLSNVIAEVAKTDKTFVARTSRARLVRMDGFGSTTATPAAKLIGRRNLTAAYSSSKARR